MASFDNVTEASLKKLKKHGYDFVKPKAKTEAARLSGPATMVLYRTGKLLIQGKKEAVSEAEKIIRYLGIAEEKKGYKGPAVGTDESLKGDTFGGIVVAGFKADDSIREELKGLGVKDSKKLLNPDVVKIATELINKYPKNYHIESLFPKEYNKLNMKMTVTEILDMLHERCFRKLASKGIIHIIDLYPGCSVGTIMEMRAESRYLEVGAASILARYGALLQIRELEMKAGFFIPLGSTHVESSLLEIKKKSLNPENFVKLKFSNVVKFFR
jgi:ribonuclease HIII